MRRFATLSLVLALMGTTVGTASPASAASPIAFWNEQAAGLSVGGTYTPIVGDFGGTDQDDIAWYAPGSGTDYLWLSDNDATFTDLTLSPINGTYQPLVGQFAGSSNDDILWYAPGSSADWLWTNTGDGTFTSRRMHINGTYDPVVIDDDSSLDDILWARPGGGTSYIWAFEGGGTYLNQMVTAPANAMPLVGQFNGGVCADIFWYGPGTAPDALWYLNCAGNVAGTVSQQVDGLYAPVVGNFGSDQDGQSDIYWYRPFGSDSLWEAEEGTDGAWETHDYFINLDATPIPAGKHWGLIHFWSPGGTDAFLWDTATGHQFSPSANTNLDAGYQPIVGDFVGTSADIFWYQPGGAGERLFFQNP